MGVGLPCAAAPFWLSGGGIIWLVFGEFVCSFVYGFFLSLVAGWLICAFDIGLSGWSVRGDELDECWLILKW